MLATLNRAHRNRVNQIAIFVIALLCYIYFFPRWADWNQNSRLNQVLAMVDDGVLYIDAYADNTGDYAIYNGRRYSDKAPGTAFIGIPIYLAFKAVSQPLLGPLVNRLETSSAFEDTLREQGSGMRADKITYSIVLYFVTIFAVSLPSAALVTALYMMLGAFTPSHFVRMSVAFAYALGTIAFSYSGLFIGHQLASAALFAAFYLLFRMRNRRQGGGSRSYAMTLVVVGFLLAFGVISDYPTVVIAACVFFYAVYVTKPRLKLSWIVIGALPPAVAAMVYNYAIFGTVLPVAYKYSALFPEHFTGGIMGFSIPSLEAVWGMTFSPYRGLFLLSPVLLLSLVGFWVWWRNGSHRAEWLVSFASVALLFLSISSSPTWAGGFSVGPRYLIAMLPFMMIPIAVWLDSFEASPAKPIARLAFLILALISVAMVWAQTIGGQQFPGYEQNPLVEYTMPKLLSGDIARNVAMVIGLSSWRSLLPLVLFALLLTFLSGVLWFSTKRQVNLPSSDL